MDKTDKKENKEKPPTETITDEIIDEVKSEGIKKVSLIIWAFVFLIFSGVGYSLYASYKTYFEHRVAAYLVDLMTTEYADNGGNTLREYVQQSAFLPTVREKEKYNLGRFFYSNIREEIELDSNSRKEFEKLVRELIAEELTRIKRIQKSYSRVDSIYQSNILYDPKNSDPEKRFDFPTFTITAYKGQQIAIVPSYEIEKYKQNKDDFPTDFFTAPPLELISSHLKREDNGEEKIIRLRNNRIQSISNFIDWEDSDRFQNISFMVGYRKATFDAARLHGNVSVFVYNEIGQ
ncbi:MAG: hypothetical protein GY807_16710 [Gammaproteobacteria bacterium]|nr:hypothetical protein [Gammaproteobacteria bacterium]